LRVSDEDTTAAQVDLSETTGTDLLDGEGAFSQFLGGTGTSTAANKLIDSGATFQTDGVVVGATVYNTGTGSKALVTAVDSETQLALDTDIFPSTNTYKMIQWRLSGGADVEWLYNDGEIEFNGTTGGVDNCEYQNILTADRYYKVTFTILSYVSGGLEVFLGSTSLGTVSANGTYTWYGMADATSLQFTPTGASYELSLDAVTLYEMGTVGIDIKDSDDVTIYTETDGTSVTYVDTEAQIDLDWSTYGLTEGECYTVCLVDLSDSSEQETNCVYYDEFDCSIKLTWTNGNNAFNFNYADFTFVQVLRLVDSIKRNAKYPEESNRPQFSDGSRSTTYGKSVKVEELQTEFLPEWIHDALRLGVIHQTFTIDSVNYVKQEGDYEPIWDRSSVDAPVILEMAKASQVAANKEC
jgi:hypothetical protein